MTIFRKISRYILGFDNTEHSEQEIFIKDLYSTQKHAFKELDKRHLTNFLETLTKKHDLLDLGLIQNKQVILATEEFNKKEIMKYFDFFENVKTSLKERVVMLHSNPWITMFEREQIVFVTKKEVKLSDIEINAITHDILNSRDLFLSEKDLVEFATIKMKNGM